MICLVLQKAFVFIKFALTNQSLTSVVCVASFHGPVAVLHFVLNRFLRQFPFCIPALRDPSPLKGGHPHLRNMSSLAFLSLLPLSPSFNRWKPRYNSRSGANLSNRLRKHHVTALISLNKDSHPTVVPVSRHLHLKVDGLSFIERADHLVSSRRLPSSMVENLKRWHKSYAVSVANNTTCNLDPIEYSEAIFSTILELARQVIEKPFKFSSYHHRIRDPFDYYKFGFDFSSVLLDRGNSYIHGKENIEEAENYVRQGHNIIFLSNHQSEGDPYAIDVMLDWIAGCERNFCENIIFMAGDRVRNDPLVSPFSAGRNLLTVYSKKHMKDEPALRDRKLLHNRRTIAETQRMFKKGGNAVWFAPSGGRDRRNPETGYVEVSHFDDGAVDMMKFTAFKSGKPSHFYPMSLFTYDMLPPPSGVGGPEVGEARVTNYTPMRMHVGKELDWSLAVDPSVTDKLGKRRAQCKYIEKIVIEGYRKIGGYDLKPVQSLRL